MNFLKNNDEEDVNCSIPSKYDLSIGDKFTENNVVSFDEYLGCENKIIKIYIDNKRWIHKNVDEFKFVSNISTYFEKNPK